MDIAADTDDEHFVIENDTNYNTQIDGSFIHIMLHRFNAMTFSSFFAYYIMYKQV